ncbi:MAG: ABC transporter permease, partial [Christensenellales bacterium]
VNTNAEEQVEYMAGADLVMQEKWQDNSQSMSDSSASSDVNYIEPDFGKYMNIDGVESVTRVYQSYDGTATTGGKTIKNVHVMGINTKEFGETAWFKPSLLSHHWYEYLNAMAQNSRALLVSSNFRDLHGLKIGDVITYKPASSGSESLRGIIYGFVDYWPTHAPVVQQKGNDGLYSESPNYLVIGNLSQIQASCGVKPYQIWMKVNGSTSFMYDYIAEHNIEMTSFADTSEALVEKKNDPMFQGTNGILTVGFIVVLLLCTTGFLIYWILSIQSRSLQFGIFRAMGMSLREILSMLINEQIFISGTSIATGAAIGILASKLYIPLIQLAYAASDNVLPLSIITDQSDFAKLFSVIGIVMLICMVILGVIISRIKIAQALKLGED